VTEERSSVARPGGFRRGRVPALDGLRGVAVSLVVFYHYFDISVSSPVLGVLRPLSSFGWSGVDLFFVLSGFLITGILVDTRGRPHYFRSFYARRSLRIFPVYYLTLIVVFVFGPALGLDVARHLAASDWLWFGLYLSNWQMGLEGVWAPAGMAVFWSLAIEEQFYLVWAPLVRALAPRILGALAIGLVAGPLLLRCILVASGAANPIAIHVLTVTRLDVLAVGACIALFVRSEVGGEQLLRAGTWALGVGAAATAALLIVQGSASWEGPAVQSVGLTAIAVAYGGVLLLAYSLPASSALVRVLTSRGLQFIGKYSYAIYVFHALVHHELLMRLQASPGTVRSLLAIGVSPWIALTVAAILVTLALSVASWHLVEKHSLAFKGRFEA